ncbi:GDSL-type esterase/lipase family protein [Dyadobacter sp. CY312]|uniref:GDSL-type esterase/lipase family protein n=1 Tax=Dyadobacter sp. CY312 TaxID=2907303 RepID=UPI001F3FED3B|nr:GDSL-type esterase/lipase family protein [Dyadobacter sp. CY312]MCE7042029.1 GDSL-type esterase/lipase family protein [Dyadobacter sp. CY312]
MRKIRVPASVGSVVLLFALLCIATVVQSQSQDKFELKDGDKIVFLGNSLFENEFQFGYLELALTTRFPGQNVTFRNLGWTGDNVWGQARSTYTNPPTPYQHLINQLTAAKPTLVFIAYGGVEAQEGEAGLTKFREGYNQLLDKIDALGAKSILLSPIPVMFEDTSAHINQRNADLKLYSSEISKIAASRKKQFIDVYNPIEAIAKNTLVIENGSHLNETGYFQLAQILRKSLGIPAQVKDINITIGKNGSEAIAPAEVATNTDGASVQFTIKEDELPLPLPAAMPNAQVRKIKIAGLKKGFYTLTADHQQIVTASAKAWTEGVAISQGPDYYQVKQVQEMIQKKNDQFFFQYRPLNRTYILGFRAYEQGRHAKGLEDQSLIMKWLEGQIATHSVPKHRVYQLKMLQ